MRDNVSLASIPCGLMADLLDLDFSNASHVSLIGIDLDPESITHAKRYAETLNLSHLCTFFERNAWALDIHEKLDLITSNGLAIYETDDAKVTELYRVFFQALKPGGYLITSFLTPPPLAGFQQDALLQKIIFADILDCKWQVFRTEETVKSQLQMAGFTAIEILYDKAHIFPTVVARKSL